MRSAPEEEIARLVNFYDYLETTTVKAQGRLWRSLFFRIKLMSKSALWATITAGFSAEHDQIIEIGAVKVEKGQITERFSAFVNPLSAFAQILRRFLRYSLRRPQPDGDFPGIHSAPLPPYPA